MAPPGRAPKKRKNQRRMAGHLSSLPVRAAAWASSRAGSTPAAPGDWSAGSLVGGRLCIYRYAADVLLFQRERSARLAIFRGGLEARHHTTPPSRFFPAARLRCAFMPRLASFFLFSFLGAFRGCLLSRVLPERVEDRVVIWGRPGSRRWYWRGLVAGRCGCLEKGVLGEDFEDVGSRGERFLVRLSSRFKWRCALDFKILMLHRDFF